MANVFEAFYEVDSVGSNTPSEWVDQKNESPYDGTNVSPSGTLSHVEIVDTPTPPSGSKCMMCYVKADDNSPRRNQLMIYNSSALDALRTGTMWTQFWMYLDADVVMKDESNGDSIYGWIRVWETNTMPDSGAYYGAPGLFLLPDYSSGSRSNDTNTLCVQWQNFGDGNIHTLQQLSSGQWYKVTTKTVFSTGTSGSFTVWIDDTQVYNATGVKTYQSGQNGIMLSQDVSGGMAYGSTNVKIYYDAFEVNADGNFTVTENGAGGSSWDGKYGSAGGLA